MEKTRILIIDEISFMSTKQITKLHINLQEARENFTKLFGGLDIIFAENFSQLKPIINCDDCGNGPIDEAKRRAYKLWQNAINCFIELKGMQ